MSSFVFAGGLAVIAYSAFTDLKTGRILNKVILPAILISLLVIGIWETELLQDSLKWGVISFGVAAMLVLFNLVGGGDGKLLALAGVIFRENVISVWLWFMLLVLIFFTVQDLRKGHNIKALLGHIFLFKKFVGEGAHYKVGGLLIFLASVITTLQIYI